MPRVPGRLPASAVEFPFGSTVYVEKKADLPTPVAGVITLVSGTTYHFTASVDLGADRLTTTVGGTIVLRGMGSVATTLSTSSASALVTADAELYVVGITLENDSGPVFSYTGTTGTGVTIEECVINNGAADTFAGVAGSTLLLVHDVAWVGAQTGVLVSGTWITATMSLLSFRNMTAGAVFVDVAAGASFTTFNLLASQLLRTDPTHTSLRVDAAVSPSQLGVVLNTAFSGPGTSVSGISPASSGWNFTANPGIADSVAAGTIQFSNNPTETAIAVLDDWYAVTHSVAFSLDAASERFELDAGPPEVLRYTGRETRRFVITIGTALEAPSSNKLFEIRVVRNGVDIAASDFTLEYKTSLRSGSHSFLVSLSTDDELAIQVRNRTDTTNVVIVEASMTAFALD